MNKLNVRAVHMGGVLSLLLLTLIAWIALKPALNSRSAYHQRVDNFQRARDALSAAQDQEDGTTRHLAALRASLEKHPLLLHPQDDLSGRLQEITDLTGRVGLQLSSIEAGKAFVYDRYGAVAIQLNARSSFPALCAFLKQLRIDMPDISVRSIDVTGRYTDKSSIPTLTMELAWHTSLPRQVASR